MPAPRRRPDGPSRPPAAERRRELLALCAPILAERGPLLVTLQELADAAGWPLARFRRVFPDPIAVFSELLGQLNQTLVPDLETADPATALSDVLTRATALGRAGDPKLRCLVWGLATPHQPQLRVSLVAFRTGLSMRLESIIRAGQQAGVFRRGLAPQQAAEDWCRAVMGMALLAPLSAAASKRGDDARSRAGEDAPPFDALLNGVLKTDV